MISNLFDDYFRALCHRKLRINHYETSFEQFGYWNSVCWLASTATHTQIQAELVGQYSQLLLGKDYTHWVTTYLPTKCLLNLKILETYIMYKHPLHWASFPHWSICFGQPWGFDKNCLEIVSYFVVVICTGIIYPHLPWYLKKLHMKSSLNK